MLNKTISLTGPQLDKVEAIMERHNLTFSAAIRKIIDGYGNILVTNNYSKEIIAETVRFR